MDGLCETMGAPEMHSAASRLACSGGCKFCCVRGGSAVCVAAQDSNSNVD